MSHRNLRVTVASTPIETFSNNDDEAVFIAFVGEAFTLSYEEPLGSLACAVARAPAGSVATFTGGALTTDAVGYCRFTAANASTPARACHAVVFPVAAKTDLRIKEPNRRVLPEGAFADPAPRSEAQVRGILRRYVLEQLRQRKDMTTFDSLTTNSPLPLSIDWNTFA